MYIYIMYRFLRILTFENLCSACDSSCASLSTTRSSCCS